MRLAGRSRRTPVLLLVAVALVLAVLGVIAAAGLVGRPGGSGPGASPDTGRTYTNPVIDVDFPDPSVLAASDGAFYAYATQFIDVREPSETINIRVARSDDLAEWEVLSDAMPRKPVWSAGTQDFWAPHVAEHGGRYLMYFSGSPMDDTSRKCLAVAVADEPAGPFVPEREPLVCGPSFQHIDPMLFHDDATGKLLLFWGSAGLAIRAQEMSEDGLTFAEGSEAERVLLPGDFPHERLIEGAWVTERDDFYYLFYSGDNYCGEERSNYAVMVARATAALGPYEKYAAAAGRDDSVVLDADERWDGPGHNSVFRDAAGEDWMLYHAIDQTNRFHEGVRNPDPCQVRRPMLMDPITYENGWPRVGDDGTPSEGPRPAPAIEPVGAGG